MSNSIECESSDFPVDLALEQIWGRKVTQSDASLCRHFDLACLIEREGQPLWVPKPCLRGLKGRAIHVNGRLRKFCADRLLIARTDRALRQMRDPVLAGKSWRLKTYLALLDLQFDRHATVREIDGVHIFAASRHLPPLDLPNKLDSMWALEADGLICRVVNGKGRSAWTPSPRGLVLGKPSRKELMHWAPVMTELERRRLIKWRSASDPSAGWGATLAGVRAGLMKTHLPAADILIDLGLSEFLDLAETRLNDIETNGLIDAHGVATRSPS